MLPIIMSCCQISFGGMMDPELRKQACRALGVAVAERSVEHLIPPNDALDGTCQWAVCHRILLRTFVHPPHSHRHRWRYGQGVGIPVQPGPRPTEPRPFFFREPRCPCRITQRPRPGSGSFSSTAAQAPEPRNANQPDVDPYAVVAVVSWTVGYMGPHTLSLLKVEVRLQGACQMLAWMVEVGLQGLCLVSFPAIVSLLCRQDANPGLPDHLWLGCEWHLSQEWTQRIGQGHSASFLGRFISRTAAVDLLIVEGKWGLRVMFRFFVAV